MKKIFKYGLGCLVLAASAAMSSCNDDDTSSSLVPAVYPSVVAVNLSPELEQYVYTDETGASVLPMIKGTSVTLNYEILPEDVTYKEVAWTSSDETVATVDADGTVTALSGDGRGYSVIQVSPVPSYAGSGIYGNLKVAVANTLVSAESIVIHAPADAIYAGETLALTASVLPAGATYRTVKWSSSNEALATVDARGVVTALENSDNHASVVITATALDGSQVYATRELLINQIVAPQEVAIDPCYAAANGYYCAINEKTLALKYTTVPEDCTLSQIEWTSDNEEVATVKEGVVTFNQEGKFGDVTITATCPETGKTSSITLNLAAGLVREVFHDKNNLTWYDAKQSGNGTSTSHEWSYGKLAVTTYKVNATTQRADFKCYNSKTWLHAGNYPIFAVRMEDVKDLPGVTGRNITLDAVGTCNGSSFKGGLDGNNNKWLHDYKCSDGSHVFIYDLSSQKWATGGILPASAVATFTSMQFKYADIKPLAGQVTYNVYWVQSFRSLEELQQYIQSEGLTYNVVK